MDLESKEKENNHTENPLTSIEFKKNYIYNNTYIKYFHFMKMFCVNGLIIIIISVIYHFNCRILVSFYNFPIRFR